MRIRKFSRNIPGRNISYTGICTLFLLTGLLSGGCSPPDESIEGVTIEWNMLPDTPTVGPATLQITLRDTIGRLVRQAEIAIEGNMSHPGMAPVTSRADEVEPGHYESDFDFTMAGDWYILIEATLEDRRTVEKQITIPGVRSR